MVCQTKNRPQGTVVYLAEGDSHELRVMAGSKTMCLEIPPAIPPDLQKFARIGKSTEKSPSFFFINFKLDASYICASNDALAWQLITGAGWT
jgi:hypothetical protein